jgi:hypothetical protein
MAKWLDNLLGTVRRSPSPSPKPDPRLEHILEGERVRVREVPELINELRRLERELSRQGK